MRGNSNVLSTRSHIGSQYSEREITKRTLFLGITLHGISKYFHAEKIIIELKNIYITLAYY